MIDDCHAQIPWNIAMGVIIDRMRNMQTLRSKTIVTCRFSERWPEPARRLKDGEGYTRLIDDMHLSIGICPPRNSDHMSVIDLVREWMAIVHESVGHETDYLTTPTNHTEQRVSLRLAVNRYNPSLYSTNYCNDISELTVVQKSIVRTVDELSYKELDSLGAISPTCVEQAICLVLNEPLYRTFTKDADITSVHQAIDLLNRRTGTCLDRPLALPYSNKTFQTRMELIRQHRLNPRSIPLSQIPRIDLAEQYIMLCPLSQTLEGILLSPKSGSEQQAAIASITYVLDPQFKHEFPALTPEYLDSISHGIVEETRRCTDREFARQIQSLLPKRQEPRLLTMTRNIAHNITHGHRATFDESSTPAPLKTPIACDFDETQSTIDDYQR